MFHARWRELIPPAGLIWMEFIDSASLKVELHLCLYCVQKSRSEIGAALTDTRRLKAICQPVSWSQIRVRNQQLPKRINSKSGKFPLSQSWWFACLACLLDNKRWIRWRRRPATLANWELVYRKSRNHLCEQYWDTAWWHGSSVVPRLCCCYCSHLCEPYAFKEWLRACLPAKLIQWDLLPGLRKQAVGMPAVEG